MRVLFVGPFSGFTSYPVVCKGLVQALTSAGFDVEVADTSWDGSPDHTAPLLINSTDRLVFLGEKRLLGLYKRVSIQAERVLSV